MTDKKHGDVNKVQCRCGSKVDHLFSYKSKVSGYRVTLCEECGIENGFDGNDDWIKMPYKEITEDFKRTPEPNAKQGN